MTLTMKPQVICWIVLMFSLIETCLSDVASFSTAADALPNEATMHALIDDYTDLIYTECYSEAEAACRQLMKLYSESPIGYYYTAALYSCCHSLGVHKTLR